MEITTEEAKKIKKHLLEQLDNFPEEKRPLIEKQIKSMNLEQLQTFLTENELIHLGGQCIFCSIVAGKTKSYKVGSNAQNIAILELNPLNPGHVLIIPKDHLEKAPLTAEHLAREIGRKIKTRLNPEEIKLDRKEIMGHPILEVIPVYQKGKMKRWQASEEELLEMQNLLTAPSQKEEIIQKPKEEPKVNLPKLPVRIP